MEIRRINILICLFLFIFIPSFSSLYGATLSKPANNLGLVEYLSFNDGTTTTAQDFSGNRNNGTLVNMSHPATASSGWGSGYAGNGVVFDGTDDYVTFDGVADNVTQTSFSVSVWVKTVWTTGFFTLWAVNTNTYGNQTQLYLDSTNFVKVYDGTSDAAEITSSILVGDNKWHHVVYTRSGATGTLYVDGINQGTHVGNDTFSANDRWSLGQEWDAGPVTSDFFKGSLDEVRVYSRVLSQNDVTNLYKSGGARINSSKNEVVKNGLVGHWTFDSKDFSDKVYDVSGNGNNGYVFSGATSTLKKIGKIGQAVYFNNSAPYINEGSPASLDNLSQKTVTMWVSRSVLHQSQTMISKMNSSGLNGWMIDARGSIFGAGPNTIRYEHNWDASPSQYAIWYGSNLLNSTSTWYHIAVSYDKSSTSNIPKIYVNGVADTVSTVQAASGNSMDDSANDLLIGTEGSKTEFHNGGIDDLRIYNRILTDAEVKQIYNATAGSKINASQNNLGQSSLNTGLVDLLSFNSKDFSDKIYDRSVSANNGYVYNTATSVAKTIGKSGQGIKFDGVNDYALQDLTSLGTLTSGTVSVWVYRTRSNVYEIMLEDTVSNISFEGDSLFSMWIANSCQTNFSSIPTGQWSHLVGTWDGTTNRVYLNGVQSSANACATPPSALSRFSIGGRYNGSVTSENFSGKMDELRIYNRALSATEVKQLYLTGR